MHLPYPLNDVFANQSHVRVLRALGELPDGLPVSARELGRRSALSHPTASKVLGSLVIQGLVLARRGPRSDAFELNRRHVLVEKLRLIFESERQLLQDLMVFTGQEIERLAPAVSVAYLFGSVARGELTPFSDIDLAVIVPEPGKIAETEAALDRLADAVRRRFGNRLNVTIATSPIDQLRRRSRPGHALWTRISQEGIAIVDRGTSRELATKRSRSA